jgi:uncharacterized membrane-anchored protein YitT (DUF2179 family)
MPIIKRSDVKDYAYIVLGMLIYAVGFTVFILPHKIVIGGMAGFSSLVFYASGERIPVAVTMYGVNIILLLCGFKMIGRTFVVRTIFGATLLSLLIGCGEGYFTSHPPLITDVTMSVIMGSVLCGLGIGTYYSHHGTAGGTDIIAAIMSKVSRMSVGRVMMVVDMTIVACSFFLPYDGDIEARIQVRTQIIIYGWLAIYLYSYITDKYLAAGRQTIQFIILSDKWQEIANRITKETGRGVTTWQATGFWTGADRTMMLVWARRYDMLPIYRIVNEVDEHAYITNSYVKSVYGNGFDILKTHKPTQK